MPMVVMKDGVNESSLKRSRQHDLPTPESPIRRSLICGGKASQLYAPEMDSGFQRGLGLQEFGASRKVRDVLKSRSSLSQPW